MMKKIFTPLKINGMVLPNRFVRSATFDNLGKDGMVSEAQLELYRALSQGEIGLIISGGIFPPWMALVPLVNWGPIRMM